HAGPRGEAVAGPYRVRLVYAGGGHQHDHHQGHDHRAASKTSGHLMAFITDRESDEPLPYLPVTAMIQGAGKAARTIQLVPLVAGLPVNAGAHAALVKSSPARGTTLVQPPQRVELTFSERLEPAYSTVAVLDGTGQQVDLRDAALSPADSRRLSVSLPPLPAG